MEKQAHLAYPDPDSWDVYLYYPERQAEIQTLTNDDVAVEYSDGMLSVYVTTSHEERISTDEEAKPFGA